MRRPKSARCGFVARAVGPTLLAHSHMADPQYRCALCDKPVDPEDPTTVGGKFPRVDMTTFGRARQSVRGLPTFYCGECDAKRRGHSWE